MLPVFLVGAALTIVGGDPDLSGDSCWTFSRPPTGS
jgi:hypothetical protein